MLDQQVDQSASSSNLPQLPVEVEGASECNEALSIHGAETVANSHTAMLPLNQLGESLFYRCFEFLAATIGLVVLSPML